MPPTHGKRPQKPITGATNRQRVACQECNPFLGRESSGGTSWRRWLELPKLGTRNVETRTAVRATRTDGRIVHVGFGGRLESRTHGGVAMGRRCTGLQQIQHAARGEASGGRCGGSPPAQGRAEGPTVQKLPVASCQLPVASCQGLQGPCTAPFLREVWSLWPKQGPGLQTTRPVKARRSGRRGICPLIG